MGSIFLIIMHLEIIGAITTSKSGRRKVFIPEDNLLDDIVSVS